MNNPWHLTRRLTQGKGAIAPEDMDALLHPTPPGVPLQARMLGESGMMTNQDIARLLGGGGPGPEHLGARVTGGGLNPQEMESVLYPEGAEQQEEQNLLMMLEDDADKGKQAQKILRAYKAVQALRQQNTRR